MEALVHFLALQRLIPLLLAYANVWVVLAAAIGCKVASHLNY